MSDASSPVLYPRYCFHLAPTVNTWCPFRVTEVHALDQHAGFEGEKFYFFKNLPIKWVRIVGVVVAIDDFSGRRVYTVDDSSGACIECTVIIPTAQKDGVDASKKQQECSTERQVERPVALVPQLYVDIDVGSVVDVKGGLSTFRDERQINIERMNAVKGTAQEVTLWEKRAAFRRDILNKPWVLRNRDIRRCRKEAERSEEEATKKRERLRAVVHGRAGREPTAQLTKKPKKDSSHCGHDGRPSKTELSRLDLRQIIQNGAKGSYDALGL